MLAEASRRHGVPLDLLRTVARIESGNNPQAVSPKGAIGIMQVMPATGRAFGADDLTDPRQNINAGARYLRYLWDRYGGDRRLVLAAYNAGPGAVDRYGGVPPYRETQTYVERGTTR
jgi:soluble lytic murein transglycosylase-like protein